MLRILLADDHDLIRAGLRSLLERQTGWSVCAEASNGRMAVEMAEKFGPDVAILDMSMAELNGLEATRHIVKSQPRTKILVYTMHETERIIVDALEAGVHGIVLKSDTSDNIVKAVETISMGRRFFTSHVAETVAELFISSRAGAKAHSDCGTVLSAREREVTQLLAEGHSNKEVADRMNISARTVEGHRAEIMRKLKIESLAELIRYAIRNEIVQP
jgi:DNA-binding NarL/FixJ family response regulator